MITVKMTISHPSSTVPGRMVSNYVSTPIIEPTAEKLSEVLKGNLSTLTHHIQHCDPSNLRVNISID